MSSGHRPASIRHDLKRTLNKGQGHAHFQGKFYVHLLGIPHTKPHTKFEVSSSSSFGYIFDRMPKIVWVIADLGHTHFQGKLFLHLLGMPHTKLHANISKTAGDTGFVPKDHQ